MLAGGVIAETIKILQKEKVFWEQQLSTRETESGDGESTAPEVAVNRDRSNWLFQRGVVVMRILCPDFIIPDQPKPKYVPRQRAKKQEVIYSNTGRQHKY
jgi:hypothetical protein